MIDKLTLLVQECGGPVFLVRSAWIAARVVALRRRYFPFIHCLLHANELFPVQSLGPGPHFKSRSSLFSFPRKATNSERLCAVCFGRPSLFARWLSLHLGGCSLNKKVATSASLTRAKRLGGGGAKRCFEGGRVAAAVAALERAAQGGRERERETLTLG